MLGLIYLCLCVGVGYVICGLLFPQLHNMTKKTYSGKKMEIPSLFVEFPAWLLVGTVPVVWITYGLGYLFRNATREGATHPEPLFWANMVMLPLMVIFIFVGIILLEKRRAKATEGLSKGSRNPFLGICHTELIYIFSTVFLASLLMFWTLFVRDGKMYVGVSVFSDFSPHFGMIRSFSYGNNFPTGYSHFGGEDIRYHFLFQFLVGNLEYLGLRIDFAFNLPSILFFVGAFFLLYALAVKLTGKRLVGYLAGLFFAFRSSRALLDFLATVNRETTTYTEALNDNYNFIGTTAHEDWGLWNLNVYCNQRHLALGICALLFLVYMFMEYVFLATRRVSLTISDRQEKLEEEALQKKLQASLIASEKEEKSENVPPSPKEEAPFDEEPEKLLFTERILIAVRTSLFTIAGWAPERIAAPIALGILLGLCSFFNGACVIGCLCVLFVLALISDHRLEYAITAALAVGLAEIETKLFITGSVVSPELYFGFLADNRSFFGLVVYILALCGILPAVLLAASVIINNTHKWVMFAFSAPFILACTLSLTGDIAVNHKYVMLSLMLLGIYAAAFVSWLMERYGIWPKVVAAFLLVCLISTGFYDMITVLKKNDANKSGCLVFDQKDPVTQWVKENASSQDLILSNYYSLNNVVLGGGMLYYGWPYYAWSAGYDTDGREKKVREMFTAETPAELDALVKENGIRYIIVDDELRNSDYYGVFEGTMQHTYSVVFEYRDMVIYDTRLPLTPEDPYYDPEYHFRVDTLEEEYPEVDEYWEEDDTEDREEAVEDWEDSIEGSVVGGDDYSEGFPDED